jgi:undecaprenyl-diphosphatase
MNTAKQRKYAGWRTWLTAVMLVLLVAAVVKNWPQVTESLATLKQMSVMDIALMSAVFALTIVSAALSYIALALHPLEVKETTLVELAASGVNRVLPAGTGSIGIHALFLTRKDHSGAEAAAVVSMNNAIGFAEHMILLGLLLLVASGTKSVGWSLKIPSFTIWIILVAAVLLLITLAIPAVRQAVGGFWQHFLQSLAQYKKRPKHLFFAYLAAVGVTLTNFIIFAVAAHAFHIDIGVTGLFLAFTLGVLVGAALPTPGGLGGVEAGLVAGLVARGVEPTPALAAAIAFRLITYWLPLLVGTPAFFVARARKLI